MIKIICVLRSGGSYDGDYVLNLHYMAQRNIKTPFQFICYTDFPKTSLSMLDNYDNIEIIPLSSNWPGWWSKMEIFRSTGACLYFDLDTVILSDLQEIVDAVFSLEFDEFIGIHSFNSRNQKRVETEFASGIMGWNGDFQFIYKTFDYARAQKGYIKDQDYISYLLRMNGISIRFWQDIISGLYSYKRHCKEGLPDDAKIVCFHGNPRPHIVQHLTWMQKYWRKSLKKGVENEK